MSHHSVLSSHLTRFTPALVTILAIVAPDAFHLPGSYNRQQALAYEASSISGEISLRVKQKEALGQSFPLKITLQSGLQTLGTYQQAENRAKEAQLLLKLGQRYLTLGRYQNATQFYQQGLSVLETLAPHAGSLKPLNQVNSNVLINVTEQESVQNQESVRNAVNDLSNQAEGYLAQKQYPQAVEVYQQLLAIAYRLGRSEEPIRQTFGNDDSHSVQFEPASYQSSKPLEFNQSQSSLVSQPLKPGLVQASPNSVDQPQKASEIVTGATIISGSEKQEPNYSVSKILPSAKDFQPQLVAIEVSQITAQAQPASLDTDDVEHLSPEEAQQSLSTYQKVLEAAKAHNNPSAIARAALSLGYIALDAEQYKDAISVFGESLQIYRQQDDRSGTAIVWLGQSRAYLGLRKGKEALKAAQNAREIAQEISDPSQKGKVLLKLSDIYYSLGQSEQTLYNQALETVRQAQDIFVALGDRRQEAAAVVRLANLYYFQEQYKPALKEYQKVSDIFRELGDAPREISALLNLGNVYLEDPECYEDINCYQEAQAALKSALALLSTGTSGDGVGKTSTAMVLLRLGDAYLASKDYDQALSYSNQALKAFKELNELDEQSTPANVKTFAGEMRHAENNISDAYLNQEHYDDAFDVLSRSQNIVQELDAHLGQVPRILKIVRGITSFGRFLPIPFFQQAAFLINSLSAAADDLITLTRDSQYLIGQVNARLSQRSLEQSLNGVKQEQDEAKAAGDRPREAKAWIALGKLQRTFAKYADSETSFHTALNLAQQLADASLEAEANLGLASSYQALGKPGEAKAAAETAQSLFHALNDSIGEANALLALGSIILGTGEFETAQKNAIAAQDLFQQTVTAEGVAQPSAENSSSASLGISPDLREARLGVAQSLLVLSSAELNLGNYEPSQKAAIEALQQFQRLGDRTGQANACITLATAFQSLGQYGKAKSYSTQALFIFRNLGDRAGEASALTTLGNILAVQKRNEQAIRSYQLSQKIENNLAESQRRPGGLTGIFRWVFRGLNAVFGWFPDSASNFVWKATGVIETVRGAVDLAEGAGASVRLGDAYLNVGEGEKARQAFEAARKAARDQGNPSREAAAWLGMSDTELNFFDNPQQALGNARQAAQLFQKINDKTGYAYSLLAQGTANFKLGQRDSDPKKQQEYYTQALVLTQASLALFQSTKEKTGEARAFAILGDLQSLQTSVEDLSAIYTAIPFYKKSVEMTEAIRLRGIRQIKYQASYISTVSETYRRLAELLLKTNNLVAAQQVLELLKIQELEEYSGTRATVSKTGAIGYSKLEKEILKAHDGSLIKLGEAIAACDPTCPDIAKINAELKQLVKEEFSEPLNKIVVELADRKQKDPQFYDPTTLSDDAFDIVDPCQILNPQDKKKCPKEVKELNTILIYPLVRKDKLWLLWTGKGNIPHRYEVDVDETTLRDSVFQFYQLLSKKGDPKELQKLGRQLYGWLIQPLENELKAGKINNLVFALDQFTRYIPMAVLVDQNNHYLIERYSVSTVISASETKMNYRLPAKVEETHVLALGQSSGETILTYVRDELSAIIKPTGSYPGKQILEQAFTKSALEEGLQDSSFRILHIATHGKFDPNVPQNSYLLTNEGKLTISDIKELRNLGRIHLVVLSACETGLGQTKKENGVEIPALSFSFMQGGKRAQSVMATLWSVNDQSTAQFMKRFYGNLAKSKNAMTKARALQEAQLYLLKNGRSDSGSTRGDSFILPTADVSKPITHDFSHPYYWAPFILIGNEL